MEEWKVIVAEIVFSWVLVSEIGSDGVWDDLDVVYALGEVYVKDS